MVFASSNLPERPPRRDPDSRRQDHGRRVRSLDPRHHQGQETGQGAGGDGGSFPEGPLGGRADPGPRDRASASSSGRRASSTSRSPSLPDKERITVDLDIQDLILEGSAGSTRTGAIQTRYPEATLVLRGGGSRPGGLLESYERARAGSGGRRAQRARDLPRERDRGQRDPEGALRAPVARGSSRSRARRSAPSTRTSCPRTPSTRCSTSFNQMYSYIFRYMVREVGPDRRERAREVPRQRSGSRARTVFGGVTLQKDGSLDAAARRAEPEQGARGRSSARGSWTPSTSCSTPSSSR